MNKVYFISEEYFKNETVVNLNVEPSLINMSIWDAQEIHIQNLLGTKLYRKLKTDIVAGSITGSYKTLLEDYVMQATAQYALTECLPYIRYKIMNKGVQSQASDNSTPTDLEELKFLQSKVGNKAEYYGQRMADYLMANMNLFPEYHSATTIDEQLPDTNAYFSGMQLDDSDGSCDRFIGYNNRTYTINT